MKWNFLTKSSYTKSYKERGYFIFWVKISSTTTILSNSWKYLPTLTSKSPYNYNFVGNWFKTYQPLSSRALKHKDPFIIRISFASQNGNSFSTLLSKDISSFIQQYNISLIIHIFIKIQSVNLKKKSFNLSKQ